ncbi:hypothetical protein F7P75_07780 [Acinetobacter gandensis]|uniref:Uncharacterized protein n=1 Tax=Acinetobacter gandensis TaxID=1443941 RepID=A0A1A7RCV3_9GAMM|nr:MULTISPECIES: hypothetical protein [Acinetobacter]KAB0627328.1 hypothetical protein F7P75_07780 [Acinetobacter gandensis]OBX29771.1 hypothetical protein A9J31_11700 [Acinetobacter gandensis]
MNQFNPPKYVKGLNIKFGENPFVLLAQFAFSATRQMWSKEEIEVVIRMAKNGNYMNLIKILRLHIKK